MRCHDKVNLDKPIEDFHQQHSLRPSKVAKSVEHGPPPCSTDLVLSRINDTCPFLACRSASLGYGKDWLAQDNVTVWDIGSWYWWSDFPVGQQYKVTKSVHVPKSVPILK